MENPPTPHSPTSPAYRIPYQRDFVRVAFRFVLEDGADDLAWIGHDSSSPTQRKNSTRPVLSPVVNLAGLQPNPIIQVD